MGKKIKLTEQQMFFNNAVYIDYLDRLKLVSLSLFEWEGLDEIAGYGASQMMEKSLYYYGRACFVKDSELGYMVLNANPSSKLNIYYLPEAIMAWSLGYEKEYKLDECVYVMNNILQKPTASTTKIFARRLYELTQTADTNVKALKTPVLIVGTENQRLSLENLYMQYDGNIPFIFGDSSAKLDEMLKVLKTDAPVHLDDLNKHKHEILNEFLTFLGINNANTDKKERLIVDEVNSNNDLINYYLNCFLAPRRQACEMINKKYGLDIKIKVNTKAVKELEKELNEYIDNKEVINNE